jgi:hypothetical protein
MMSTISSKSVGPCSARALLSRPATAARLLGWHVSSTDSNRFAVAP